MPVILDARKKVTSGNIISSASADPIRLVQEELSVAERRFSVLINSHDDCLDVVVAPTFAWSYPSASSWEMVRLSAIPRIRARRDPLSKLDHVGIRLNKPNNLCRTTVSSTLLTFYICQVVKAFSMPLNYPLKHRYYFCDESSFMTGEFMGIAGLVVLEGSIPILRDELAKIRKANQITRSEIKWSNIQKTDKQARIDFIDYFWFLLDKGRVDFHIRFAPFDKYDHKDYKGRRFDTTSRMFYELLLHRAVKHYGKWDRLFIRPDNGDCTSVLPHLKAGLNADGVRKFGRLARAIAQRFGLRDHTPQIVSADAIAAELGDWARGRAMDQQLSGEKARRELGWKPVHLDPEGEIAALATDDD
jgi:hypothetical protein